MIRVALIDGPLPTGFPGVVHQQDISPRHPQAIHSPAARHAVQMALAIRAAGADVKIDNYVVFPGHLGCSLDTICTALNLAAHSKADILHCSFGLPDPAPTLAQAVRRALAAGKRVVASAAARGGTVFPAGYDGVISVQGDARCGPSQWSWLGLTHAAFGACAEGKDTNIRGASVAAAHFTGHLAAAMQAGRVDHMREQATFQGRERILMRPATQQDIGKGGPGS